MSKIQREDTMFTQDQRLDDRVSNLELWRRTGVFGSGGGGSGASILLDSWHFVGAAGEPGFQNSWTNYGGGWKSLSFRKDPFGKVSIFGLLAKGGGNWIAGEIIFTLPAGYRPPTTHMFSGRANPGTAANSFDNYNRMDIGTDGTVKLVTGGATNPVSYLWLETEFDTDTVTTVLTGPKGDKGDTGAPGPAPPVTYYVHTQATPSDTWVVTHNLGYFPNVAPVDSLNRQFIADVTYIDNNTLNILLTAATAGKAYVS